MSAGLGKNLYGDYCGNCGEDWRECCCTNPVRCCGLCGKELYTECTCEQRKHDYYSIFSVHNGEIDYTISE